MKKIILSFILVFLFFGKSYSATTVTYNATDSAQDGYIYATAGTPYSNLAGVSKTINKTSTPWIIRKSYLPSYFVLENAFLHFGTNALPDNAVVTSARLYLSSSSGDLADTDGRNIDCEYYTWSTLSESDWTYSVNPNAFSADLSGYNRTGTWFTLSNLSNINKTGYTGFRLSVSGGEPSGQNYFYLSFAEETAYCKLEVTYVVPFSGKLNGVSAPTKVNGVTAIKVNGI